MRFDAICLILLAIAAIEIVVAEDQSLPDGTIYGHAYDAQTKQPVSGAFVYCQETKCKPIATDSDGYYAIENCFSPSSTYNIECTKYGYESAKDTAQTDSSGKVEVDFNLELTSAEDQVVETAPDSGKVSGTGSLKKEYHILNEANDYANVSVDIKNADYYEYEYRIDSDERQCLADLNITVKHAESITCSGGAKNRNNIPVNITTLMTNGDLTYNNSVMASDQGVQASQNIINANGNNFEASSKALGDNNIILGSIVSAYHSESLNGTQNISIGKDTLTYTGINAIAGPLEVASSIAAEDRTLNATAAVIAGVAAVNQGINLTDAHQYFKGVTGGADFDTSIETAFGDGTHVYGAAGSGNLSTVSQHASAKDAYYKLEYEYMPVSYSTGTYDIQYARGSSVVRSDKKLATNILQADNCEHMQAEHETNLDEENLTHARVDAIAGPIEVTSSIAVEDRTFNATAAVVAGIIYNDQLVSLSEARQDSNGMVGGAIFSTAATNADRKTTRAYTMIGSGNLVSLSQLALLNDAHYKVEYGYMPVSYSTGTYDTDLNTSRIERY